MAKQRWNEMSQGRRRMVVAAGVVETIFKVLALADIKRRPASQIRGKKWAWALAVTFINAGGAVPISYFVFGRRREPSALPV
jgi:hypothetical protein